MACQKSILQMGRHLILDFVDVETTDLNSFAQVNDLFMKALTKVGLEVVDLQKKEFEPQGLTCIYMLKQGHLTIHAWPEARSCAIDFYHCGSDTWNVVQQVEESLCDVLGWDKCSSTVTIPRGGNSRIQCNNNMKKCEIQNDVKLLHREKTPYQDLRIYDSKYLGRILVLDGQVQISDKLDDNYTLDMSRNIVNEEDAFEHILIIGGGDMLIANYLLENYQNIKHITVCEIDERVVENVRKYFKMSENINNNIQSGRLSVVYKDGALYAKELADNKTLVDGIIIDCTDVWLEGGVASSLFTVEFYTALKQCMKDGAKFSQQLSVQDVIPSFKIKMQEAGFQNVEILQTKSPEYGEDIPIAYVGIN